MIRSVTCSFVAGLVAFAAVASAQSDGSRRAPRNDGAGAPPPRTKPNSPTPPADSGPARPEGFKPISLATAQKESERLRATITRLEERVAAGKSEAGASAE